MHIYYLALGGINLIGNIRDGGDDIHIELPEEAFLHDFQVQQSEEAAAEAEA